MKRTYRKSGEAVGVRRTINLSADGKDQLATIPQMLTERWHLSDKPSVSLMLESLIFRWADEMKNDPAVIQQLIDEIEARGGARGSKDQFRKDEESFLAKRSANP